MACVSGTTETKGVAEGISAMTNKNDRIDDLLKRNVEQQLANFDWEKLTKGIRKRLAVAEVQRTFGAKYASLLKVAAAIAVATTVVFIAVMVRMSRPPVMESENAGNAPVKFVERTGSASVEIKSASVKPHVIVDIGTQDRKLATCDIEIIDENGSRRQDGTRAAWVIISRTERIYAGNGFNDNMKDLICLF
jgi:hypothetical protein